MEQAKPVGVAGFNPWRIVSRCWHALWRRLGAAPVWQKLVGLVVTPVLFAFYAAWVLVADGAAGRPGGASSWHPGLTVLIAGLLGLGLSAGLAYALTRPMHGLIEAMGRIQRGDLGARVKPWAKDEIGEVQVAFNRLVEQLERSHIDLVARNAELGVLNDLSLLVSVGRDVIQMMVGVLPLVIEVLAADHGRICIPSGSGLVTIHTANRGEPASAVTTRSAPSSEGSLMDQVMLAGCSMTLSDVADGDLSPGGGTVGGFASWAGTPLRVQELSVGALGVGRRDGPTFERADLDLLEAIGNVVGIGLFNVQLLSDLKRGEAELRGALRRAVEIQEDERRRIARELHDETGQALTSMLLHLKALQGETDVDVIHDRVNGMRFLAGNTLEEVRRLSLDLRPALLDDLGLVPALEWLVGRHAASTNCKVALEIGDLPESMPADMEISLFRMIQEGLTNVVRHSGATRAEVTLAHDNGRLVLRIADNGCGMDPTDRPLGLGLVGMRERVDLLGGTMSVESAPGRGTRLVADLALLESG